MMMTEKNISRPEISRNMHEKVKNTAKRDGQELTGFYAVIIDLGLNLYNQNKKIYAKSNMYR
jgi:hypothetical protein